MYMYSNPSTSTNPRNESCQDANQGTTHSPIEDCGRPLSSPPRSPPTDSRKSASFSAFPLTYSPSMY